MTLDMLMIKRSFVRLDVYFEIDKKYLILYKHSYFKILINKTLRKKVKLKKLSQVFSF